MRINNSGLNPVFLIALLLTLAACQPGDSPDAEELADAALPVTATDIENAPSNESGSPDDSWGRYVNQYIEDYFVAHPA
ncbi:MAG: hypothetical protein IIB78_11060, partial [Proteobacteria bacterium]|nr:hypothetical protein [Pseudomonadota bacterium]